MSLTDLWDKFRPQILGRVDLLDQATVALLEGNLQADQRRRAEQEAHKLAGTVGSFGFHTGSRLAREAEKLLVGDTRMREDQILRLSQISIALREELSGLPAEQSSQPQVRHDQPRLLVVDDDGVLAEQLAAEAAGRGIRAEVALSIAQAQESIRTSSPDVILLDLLFPGGEDGSVLLADLSALTPPIPVLVYTARDALADRVTVARLGGRGFLHKPMPPAQVVDEIIQLLERTRAAKARIMAVDDDPVILAALRETLEPSGYKLSTLVGPLDFWTTLEETSPDLLVLDIDMPHVNGIELCRVVRNDPRWNGLSILVLTARVDAETIHEVFEAGADDYVPKPFIGPELLTRIGNRLERNRIYREMAETDYLTHVASRRKSSQQADLFVQLARRSQNPMTVAAIDVDHFKQVNDQFGHAVGDVVLRQLGELLLRSFRGDDVVGRWGGEEFMVAMYGMSREDGVLRLAEVLDCFRNQAFKGPHGELFHATFTAGVAQFPKDGEEIHELYRAADAALYRAKAAGRNRVVSADWHT